MKISLVQLAFTCSILVLAKGDTDFKTLITSFSRESLAEDGKLNFTQLGSKYGHTVQQFEVVTEDRYILTLFHIPGDKDDVMLFHGICDVSDTYIIRGYDSLAITLADAGYGVWVGNSRGTKYGRRHLTLDPDTDKEFWEYTFHEIGYYDVAAIIDFICGKTGKTSIASISHSQGTTAHLVLTSTRPEYNAKIKTAILLAPVAFMNHMPPQIKAVALAGPAIDATLKLLGINELVKDQNAASNLIAMLCSKGIVSYAVCALGALFPFSGFDPSRIEPEFLNVIFGHYPAATSRKALVHYDQVILRGKFSQYDYGEIKNMARYGASSPPEYDLSAISTKIAIMNGKNDQLSRPEDVEQLNNTLPNVVYYKVMEPELWSHIDFVWGRDMSTYLFPYIFKVLEDHY